MKRYVLYIAAMFAVLIVGLIGLDRSLNPHNQVNRLNYIFIHKGMEKNTVQWILGDSGLPYAVSLVVKDSASIAGQKKLVEGEEVRSFSNYPPEHPRHVCYIGFTDNIVVDMYFGEPPSEDDKVGWK